MESRIGLEWCFIPRQETDAKRQPSPKQCILKRGNKMTLKLPALGNRDGEMNLQNSARTRKLDRDEEDNQFGRSKLHFHSMQISDCRYFEKVLRNLLKKFLSRRRRTSNWYRSVEDQRIDLENVYVENNESRHSLWTK